MLTWLQKDLKHLGLWKFAGAVMYVLKEVLGLSEEKMIVPVDEKRGRLLLAEILDGGNFGRHFTKYAGFTHQSMGKKYFLKIWRNMHFVRYYPAEALSEPIFRTWHFFWRLKHRRPSLGVFSWSPMRAGFKVSQMTQISSLLFLVPQISQIFTDSCSVYGIKARRFRRWRRSLTYAVGDFADFFAGDLCFSLSHRFHRFTQILSYLRLRAPGISEPRCKDRKIKINESSHIRELVNGNYWFFRIF